MANTRSSSSTARPGAVRGDRRRRRSTTAVASEAAREGTTSEQRVPDAVPEVPSQDEALRSGDPDVSGLDAAHVGDATPAGSTPTPDQSRVDEIGRALGVEEVDEGELSSSAEILEERDRRGVPGRSRK